MARTIGNLRPLDQQRAGRLLLGWLRGDKLAIDAVLRDAEADTTGPAGLLFAVTQLAADLTRLVAPTDAEAQLQRALLHLATEGPKD